MTRILATFFFSTLFISISWGQKITATDSLKVMTEVDKIFKVFSSPKLSEFEQISTERIYCIMCFDRPKSKDNPYMLNRKLFFDNYLQDIGKSDIFIRATKKFEVVLVADNNRWSDISVFFTVYQKDELAVGHEGAQLGFYFKKEKDEFKFSGIETIP